MSRKPKPKIVCVPRELVEASLRRAARTFVRGVAKASRDQVCGILEDIFAERALLWLIIEDDEAVGTFMTTIISDEHDGPFFVWVYGLGGEGLERWARALAARMLEFADAERCQSVRFSGRKGWGRVLAGWNPIAELGDEVIYERAAA